MTQSAILPSASSDRRGVVGLLVLLFAITYLDRVCISVAGPRMQEDLGIDPIGWGWVTGMFTLAYCLFEIPTGMMGDRIGPRRVLTRIVVWWSAFTALTGAMTSYLPAAAHQVPVRGGRSRRVSECVSGGVAMVPAAATRHDVRREPDGQPGGRRHRAAAGAADPDALRLADVVLRIRRGRAGLGGGLVRVVPRFARREARARLAASTAAAGSSTSAGHAFPWRVAYRSKTVWSILGLAFCYVYVYNFFQTWFHTFLVRGRGFSEANLLLSALPYVVAACANLAGGAASDALVRRLGAKRGRRVIGATALTAAAAFTVAAMLTHHQLLTVVFLALTYGAITFQQSGVFGVCLDIGGPRAGAMVGLMNTIAQVGGLAGSVLYGYIVDRTGSYDAPFIPMTVLLLIGAVLWVNVDASRELGGEPHEAL